MQHQKNYELCLTFYAETYQRPGHAKRGTTFLLSFRETGCGTALGQCKTSLVWPLPPLKCTDATRSRQRARCGQCSPYMRQASGDSFLALCRISRGAAQCTPWAGWPPSWAPGSWDPGSDALTTTESLWTSPVTQFQ